MCFSPYRSVWGVNVAKIKTKLQEDNGNKAGHSSCSTTSKRSAERSYHRYSHKFVIFQSPKSTKEWKLFSRPVWIHLLHKMLLKDSVFVAQLPDMNAQCWFYPTLWKACENSRLMCFIYITITTLNEECIVFVVTFIDFHRLKYSCQILNTLLCSCSGHLKTELISQFSYCFDWKMMLNVCLI